MVAPTVRHPALGSMGGGRDFRVKVRVRVRVRESSAFLSRVLLPSVYELPSRAMPTSWITSGLPGAGEGEA